LRSRKSRGDFESQIWPAGNGNLVLCASAAHELQQVFVAKNRTARQDGPRDLDAVVCEEQHELGRSIRMIGDSFGDADADRHLDVFGQVAKNIGGKAALARRQFRMLLFEQRAHGDVNVIRAAGMRKARERLELLVVALLTLKSVHGPVLL
jgi:hypothetical protein